MNKINKNDKILIFSFIIILFLVFLSYPIIYIGVSNGFFQLQITDNLKSYKSRTGVFSSIENKILSKEVSIENKAINYFPFYFQLNSFYQNLEFSLNDIIYKNDIPIGKNSDSEYIFYDKKNKFYYLLNDKSEKELQERVERQILFFNNLSNLDLDIYLYIPVRYDLTNLNKSVTNRGLQKYIKYFTSNLDSKINYDVMEINSIEEYKDKFYLTDHHWNINGALDSYYSILKMMKKNPIYNLKGVEVSNRKFYGSIAKTALSTRENDYILDINEPLDYKSVKINGKSVDNLFKPRKIKDSEKRIFYDYYVGYFNGQYGEIIYDNNNDKEENLLILSDSYSWQIDYLLAKSFNKTFVLNFRYYNDDFNLQDYIKKNNIDKLLFLYEGSAILFDQYDYKLLEKGVN